MPTREAPDLAVYINHKKEEYARVLTVSQSIEGKVPDTATLRIEPDLRDEPKFQGKQLSQLKEFENVECVISVKTRKGAPQIIHWGKIAGGDVQISGDSVTVTSRMDDHLFGKPYTVTEEAVYPSPKFKTKKIDVPHAVMNPRLDGRIVPNMWFLKDPKHNSVFVCPSSLPKQTHDPIDPTPKIKELKSWTLTEAAAYLIWTLNPTQKYIKNPSRKQLAKVLGSDTAIVREHEIKIGSRLPALLDDLLEPYGFFFYVEYKGAYRILTVASRDGNTSPITLKRARWGEQVDLSRTEVIDAKLRIDHVHRAVNQVEVLGDFHQFESTWELFPAWKWEHDELFGSDLALDSLAMQSDPTKSRAWRDWVLGEGGDYQDIREKATTGVAWKTNQAKAHDFSTLFGTKNYITKRRRFEPTLTLSPSLETAAIGTWDGVYVEWWDGAYWQPITRLSNQSVQILVDECGVRFSNPASPPEEIISMGIDAAKIRVTASVRSDRRLRGLIGSSGSLILDPRRQIVDVGDEYQSRKIATTSIFYDRVTTTKTLRSEQQDDQIAIVRRAQALHRSWHHTAIGGPITIDGIDWGEAVLGRGVKAIEPAGISLLATGALSAGRKYPIVKQVIWDVQQQTTTLNLETFRRLEVG